MILVIIGAVLSLVIPFVIYKIILRGKEKVSVKRLIITFILGATLFTIPIIVLELIWDKVFHGLNRETVFGGFMEAYFRAALIEECVKLLFAFLVLRKHKDLSMREMILITGLIGVGYGFTEKLAYGAGGALLINALAPGHLLFQWVMGYFLYKAFHAEKGNKWKYLVLAYVVPFAIHGTWDFLLNLSLLLPQEDTITGLISALLTPIFIAVMAFAIVRGAIKIRKLEG